MINAIRNLSIHRKLLLTVLFPSLASLVFAGLFLFVLEVAEFQQKAQDELSTLAVLIGNRSIAAVAFQDVELANENLNSLKTMPPVQYACLFDADGKAFTHWSRDGQKSVLCPKTNYQQMYFEGMRLHIVMPIVDKNEKLGWIYILADFSAAYWQRIQLICWLFLVLFGAYCLTYFLSVPLIKLISRPIKHLANTVKTIVDSKDYRVRAEKFHDDEMGMLVDAFNGLISMVNTQNQALTKTNEKYLALYNNNPTMVFNLTEDGIIRSVNLTGARYIGLPVKAMQERPFIVFVHADDFAAVDELIEGCLLQPSLVYKQEFRLVCDNGEIIWVRATSREVDSPGDKHGLLLVCEDVTEAHLLTEKIAYQASHDNLTGLANRAEFDKAIINALAESHAEGSEHALCYLDLDQFKVVNDTCGHLVGDELLKQLGGLLKNQVRRHDFIARLGGDEFGVLMYNCPLDDAFTVCEQIRDAVRDFNFAWGGRSFTVGISIGVASINRTGSNAVDLLKEADAACYVAKDKGRNRVHIYLPDDKEMALRHGEMEWVTRLLHGLEHSRFRLYGQPIVPLAKSDEGLHFEVLVRYADDRGGIVPPGAFLPAAERYNLAPALDRWVIVNLFEWVAGHPEFLEKLSMCSINLSGLTLADETMLKFISEQLDVFNIPAHKICFEVTETAAITNLSYASEFILQLKKKGCSFSLDDFGSGLSSFAYLKSLAVDFLKIDGLFVKDILDDQVDLAMVKSINDVGHIMGKKTIAEFVENIEIFDLLAELGVDYAQGYGIGKPMPINELLTLKPFAAGQ
jgi:diguanylate cyclase (GGDEF)-like protein/PAS domain S-box-containing protein